MLGSNQRFLGGFINFLVQKEGLLERGGTKKRINCIKKFLYALLVPHKDTVKGAHTFQPANQHATEKYIIQSIKVYYIRSAAGDERKIHTNLPMHENSN